MSPIQPGACANCGGALAGPYCHTCGQEAVFGLVAASLAWTVNGG